ncbi:MAG: hypothetical protein ACKVW3_05060, partial [Phycisphaerales bacterium]
FVHVIVRARVLPLVRVGVVEVAVEVEFVVGPVAGLVEGPVLLARAVGDRATQGSLLGLDQPAEVVVGVEGVEEPEWTWLGEATCR